MSRRWTEVRSDDYLALRQERDRYRALLECVEGWLAAGDLADNHKLRADVRATLALDFQELVRTGGR